MATKLKGKKSAHARLAFPLSVAREEDIGKVRTRRTYRLPSGTITREPLYLNQALNIRKGLEEQSLGLFDEPGLGKTAQALYIIHEQMRMGVVDAYVIVCKRIHFATWRSEIKKHLGSRSESGFRVHEVASTGKPRGPWHPHFNIFIVSYDLLNRAAKDKRTMRKVDGAFGNHIVELNPEARHFLKVLRKRRTGIACDESQYLKNPDAKITRVLCFLAQFAVTKYLLTGTPIADRPEDIWSQAFFLRGAKTLFGDSYQEFLYKFTYGHYHKARWVIDGYRDMQDLRNGISEISVRRLKKDCLDLPAKVFKDTVLGLHGDQLSIVRTIRDELVCELLRIPGPTVRLLPGSSVVKLMQQLHRVAACPQVVVPSAHVNVKRDAMLGVMEEIGDEPAVVWCFHRDVCNWYYEFMKSRMGMRPLLVTGDVPVIARERCISMFQDGSSRCLIATLDTLREGVTLTRARNAVYIQQSFRRLSWVQSLDRIHRIGQTGTVVINRFISTIGMDKYIYNSVNEKNNVADAAERDRDEVRYVINKWELINALRDERESVKPC